MFHIYEGFHLVDAYHKMRHQRKYHPEDSAKRAVKIALVAFVTLLLWNMPSEWFGIQELTVVQQRIIAIFAFATLMWVLEVVSSWATSVAIIGLMLLFASDSGVKWMCNPDEVGQLLSYKAVMATFADPVIMLFIGGFILAIAAQLPKRDLTPSWQKCCSDLLVLRVKWCSWASCSSLACSRCSYPTLPRQP